MRFTPPRSLDSPLDRARRAVSRRLGVDARALAALRIALGTLLLTDLALRARSLTAFYTDAGVLPRDALAALYPVISQFSLHALSGAGWWQAALFAVAGGFALALALGYRTRQAAAASLLLLVSLHARNPLVLNAGDAILRRLLLWACFLPLGARWSLDARATDRGHALDATDDRPRRVTRLASAALLLQVVTVYAVNFLFKLRSDAWRSGTAVARTFALDLFTTGVGDALAASPALLELANWTWLALLAASPLLVLGTGRVRTALVACFAATHVGMLATMPLGIFPLVSLTALLPFLPPDVWNRVETTVTTAPDAPPARPALGTAALDGGRHDRHTTIRRVRTALTALTPAVVALLVLTATTWNLATLGVLAAPTPDDGSIVSPDAQRWDMFAHPPTADAWYVTNATLATGRHVDALRGGPTSPAKPPDVSASYPTDRWQKYLVTLWLEHPRGLRDDFGHYLCRRTAARHDAPVTTVTVTIVESPTRYAHHQNTTRTHVGTYDCQ